MKSVKSGHLTDESDRIADLPSDVETVPDIVDVAELVGEKRYLL